MLMISLTFSLFLVHTYTYKQFTMTNKTSKKTPRAKLNRIYDAAFAGDLEMIKKFYNKDLADSDVFYFAAENGDLKIMKWLHENKCPWNSQTFWVAAKKGDLKMMKWLHKNKCPWDAATFGFAAQNGNLKNMKWLKEQGCPWDTLTFRAAVLHGNIKNIEWLYRNKCPWNYLSKYIIKNGSNGEHRMVFKGVKGSFVAF